MKSFRNFLTEGFGEVDPQTDKAIDAFSIELIKLIKQCKPGGNFYKVINSDMNADTYFLKEIVKKLESVEDSVDELHRSAADYVEADPTDKGNKMLQKIIKTRKKRK